MHGLEPLCVHGPGEALIVGDQMYGFNLNQGDDSSITVLL